MPYNHADTTNKNARLNADVTALGSGAKLVLGTSALNGTTGVLGTITLGATAGTVSNGVLTISGLPLNASGVVPGTLAKAELRTSADVVIVTGLTIGTSGADIIVGTTTVNSGNVLTISSATVTAS